MNQQQRDERDDTVRGLGMLSDEPMVRCSGCGHWSYLAAISGICLNCSVDRGLIRGDDHA